MSNLSNKSRTNTDTSKEKKSFFKKKKKVRTKQSLLKKIKLLIIDDHKLIRDGIKVMLTTIKSKYAFEISEAENGIDALEKIRKKNYHLAILDYQMPQITGNETAKALKGVRKDLKILALSNYDEYHYIISMINSGANGYILKDIGPDELLLAIETILNGRNYFSDAVASKIMNFKTIEKSDVTNECNHIHLTERQKEVLKLIAKELTNEQIATEFRISRRTVETHRQNIMHALGVKNAAGLIKMATLHKFI